MAEPSVLFKREKNRTAEDVFRGFIQPELRVLANDIGQKLIHRAKHTHTYQNRTGALEDSKRWDVTEEERIDPTYEIEVTAGGPGRVQFPLREGKRKTKQLGATPTGQARRIRRRGTPLIEANPNVSGSRRDLKKGDVILVDYATFVEKKGFDVLIGSVTYFQSRIPAIMRDYLRGISVRI